VFSLFFGPTRFMSVQLALSPLRCRLSSGRRRHAIVLCHAYFPWSQDELTASTSSSVNASSCRVPSQAEIKALNPHHCRRPPSSNNPTLTVHYYKKFISTLFTLLTTQLCLHFASFIARASRNRSSIHCRRFLSPLSHAHRPFTQRHQQ
jgi:hypothetical protein